MDPWEQDRVKWTPSEGQASRQFGKEIKNLSELGSSCLFPKVKESKRENVDTPRLLFGKNNKDAPPGERC